nr:ABC transporter permease [bacterium]
MTRKSLSYPYLVWMALFILLPLGLIIYYSVTSDNGGFTLEHFSRFLEKDYLMVLARSLWLALICTVICLLLGYPAAYILASRTLKRANMLLVLFLLPMWMNFLLRTYAWAFLLERGGIIYTFLQKIGISDPPPMLNTQGAIVLGMVYNFLPFMVLPIYTALSKMDHHLVEAAYDLGATPVRVFGKITLPLSMPGVISGITMVFMPSASTFVISKLLGGGKQMLIGDLIESQFTIYRNWHFGSAVSIVLMLFILLSMRMVNGASEADLDRGKSREKRRRRA